MAFSEFLSLLCTFEGSSKRRNISFDSSLMCRKARRSILKTLAWAALPPTLPVLCGGSCFPIPRERGHEGHSSLTDAFSPCLTLENDAMTKYPTELRRFDLLKQGKMNFIEEKNCEYLSIGAICDGFHAHFLFVAASCFPQDSQNVL